MQTNESPQAAEPIIVAEFDKNRKERLRVSLTEFQGHELCDIRLFYGSADGLKPGKGIAIQRSLIPDLVRALRQADKMQKGEKPKGERSPSATAKQETEEEDE